MISLYKNNEIPIYLSYGGSIGGTCLKCRCFLTVFFWNVFPKSSSSSLASFTFFGRLTAPPLSFILCHFVAITRIWSLGAVPDGRVFISVLTNSRHVVVIYCIDYFIDDTFIRCQQQLPNDRITRELSKRCVGGVRFGLAVCLQCFIPFNHSTTINTLPTPKDNQVVCISSSYEFHF